MSECTNVTIQKRGRFIRKFEYLDRIAEFLKRQKYAGRNSSEILNAFTRFYRETSLSDYAVARMLGVDTARIPSWINGTHQPQFANQRKIERFMETYAREYLQE